MLVEIFWVVSVQHGNLCSNARGPLLFWLSFFLVCITAHMYSPCVPNHIFITHSQEDRCLKIGTQASQSSEFRPRVYCLMCAMSRLQNKACWHCSRFGKQKSWPIISFYPESFFICPDVLTQVTNAVFIINYFSREKECHVSTPVAYSTRSTSSASKCTAAVPVNFNPQAPLFGVIAGNWDQQLCPAVWSTWEDAEQFGREIQQQAHSWSLQVCTVNSTALNRAKTGDWTSLRT